MWGQDHVGCVSQPPKQTTWPPNSDKPTGARTHARTWRRSHSETTLPHACVIKFGSEYPHKCMQLCINSVCFVKPLHSRNPLSFYSTPPLTLVLHPCMAWPNTCSELLQERLLSMWHSLPTKPYCRFLIQHWLLRQVVINEAHNRWRGFFLQLQMFFCRRTCFKVFRLSEMIQLPFERPLHYHNWRDTCSFLRGSQFQFWPQYLSEYSAFQLFLPLPAKWLKWSLSGCFKQMETSCIEGNVAESHRHRWRQTTVI